MPDRSILVTGPGAIVAAPWRGPGADARPRERIALGKLIINHGERVTEHVLHAHPLVIGRDPECDLFFADKKLSRRHARIVSEGSRFKLVDLGSRNGSWVNEERIDEAILAPGDTIRLGGLRITFEDAPPEAREDGDQSTVYLSKGASPDDSSTVLLGPEAAPAPSESPPAGTVALSTETDAGVSDPDDSSTVMFSQTGPASSPPSDELDVTLDKPRGGELEEDRTVQLPGEPGRAEGDTGTVIFRGKVDPQFEAAARIVSPEEVEGEPAEDESLEGESSSEIAAIGRSRAAAATGLRGVVYLAVIAASVAVLSLLVLVLPMLRTLENAVLEESRLRGRALLELLAAANTEALVERREEALSVDSVAEEPGVTGAYILDPLGKILAPAELAGESPAEALPARPGAIRSFLASESSGGGQVVARPIVYRDRRVGIAVIAYRPASSGWSTMVLGLGSVLMLLGVFASALLGRRLLLAPLVSLRDEVEELESRGDRGLSAERPYRELSELAISFNRVLASSSPGAADETFEPDLPSTRRAPQRNQTRGPDAIEREATGSHSE